MGDAEKTLEIVLSGERYNKILDGMLKVVQGWGDRKVSTPAQIRRFLFARSYGNIHRQTTQRHTPEIALEQRHATPPLTQTRICIQ